MYTLLDIISLTTIIFSALNIALNKPTKQSSTFETYVSSLAVDGFSGTRNAEGTVFLCAQTQNGIQQEWWVVDLQTEYKVDTIHIRGRTDCCCK